MIKKELIALLIILLLSQGVIAQNTLFARTNGNWNNGHPTAGTWSTIGSSGPSCGCVPSNDDAVVIDGFNVTLPNNGSAKDLTIQGGGALSFNNNSTLSIHNSGSLQLINGVVSHNGPTSNARLQFMSGNYSMNIQNGFNFDIDDLIIEDGVNLVLVGTGNIELQNDLSFEGNGSVFTNNSSGHFIINRDLCFEPGFASNLFINNGKLTINDDISLDGNANKINNNDSIILNDDVSFLSNSCQIENNQLGVILCDDDISFLNTTNNKVVNKGLFLVRGQGVGGIVFEGQRDTIENHGTMHSLMHLKVQASHHDDNVFINKSGSILNVDGEFDLNDADFRFENFGIFNLTGRLDEMGGNEVFLNGSGAVFNYYGSHNTDLNTEIAIFANFSANEINFLGSSNQDVIVPQDAYWSINFGGSSTKEIQGDLIIEGNVNIALNTVLDVGADNFSLSVKGDWTSNGIFQARSGQVVFDGSGNQLILSNGVNSFYSLSINKPNGSVSLLNDVNVANLLELNNGSIQLNANSLTILSSNVNSIIRNNGFIISEQVDNSSKLIRNIGNNNGNYVFPFGTTTGNYIPFILESTAGDFGFVTVSTYKTGANNLPWPTVPEMVTNLNSVINAIPDNRDNTIDRFWQIDKSGPTGTANITFHYAQSEVSGNVVNSEGLLQAQRYNTSTDKWEPALPNQITNGLANSVNVNGVSNFSPWSLALSSSPLPITLIHFDAVLVNDDVNLNWTTSAQLNNDYFTLEKSVDAEFFEEIATVEGAGTTNLEMNYSEIDLNANPGTIYYRLKQTDFDGNYTYSDVVSISVAQQSSAFTVYPNPIKGNSVQFKLSNEPSNLAILVHDIAGKVCYGDVQRVDALSNQYTFEMNENMPTGTYFLTVQSEQDVFTTKFIKTE